MNSIIATVSNIESTDNITIVTFQTSNQQLRMMSLGLNTPISIGSKVKLGAKASSIALAKGLSGMLSTSNQLKCSIESVNNGVLLSSIKLRLGNSIIESVITKESSIKMKLQKGDTILALIKASELSILEVDNQV